MFQVGDQVVVARVNKNDPPRERYADLTKDRNYTDFLGRLGKVTKVHRGNGGVGDSKNDPFYIVEFPGNESDGFWSEELEPLVKKR